MKSLVTIILFVTATATKADLIEYVFVPFDTTGPTVSGVVWTDPSFGTLSGNMRITGNGLNWYVDFSDTIFGHYLIHPTSENQPPPYLTPFVIGGFTDMIYATFQLNPIYGYGPGDGAAIQGWRVLPDPGTGLSDQSGVGVWQLAQAAPDASSSAFLLLLGIAFVFGLNRCHRHRTSIQLK